MQARPEDFLRMPTMTVEVRATFGAGEARPYSRSITLSVHSLLSDSCSVDLRDVTRSMR
jgi:hypothetical protein